MARLRYEIELPARSLDSPTRDVALRTISPADVDALAALMLDSYTGTIDYDGEDLDDAVAEITGYFAETPLLEHSYAIDIDGVIGSAVLVSRHEGQPFVSYVMTRAEHKGKGLARTVTRRALDSLTESGHDIVALYITEGNTPSEALFRSLGATPTPDVSLVPTPENLSPSPDTFAM